MVLKSDLTLKTFDMHDKTRCKQPLSDILSTFMYVAKGVKFGPDPLLDRVEQLHTADPLQLLRNPVSET